MSAYRKGWLKLSLSVDYTSTSYFAPKIKRST